MFQLVGHTIEGKPVVSGVYRVFETHGLPLEVLLQGLQDKGVVPCWMSLYREASAAGVPHERILSKLDQAVSDSYGKDFRDNVIRSLQRLHEAGKL